MSSEEAWDSLQKDFTSSTKACVMQIHVELATSKKFDMSVINFFCKRYLSSPSSILLYAMRRSSHICQ